MPVSLALCSCFLPSSSTYSDFEDSARLITYHARPHVQANNWVWGHACLGLKAFRQLHEIMGRRSKATARAERPEEGIEAQEACKKHVRRILSGWGRLLLGRTEADGPG